MTAARLERLGINDGFGRLIDLDTPHRVGGLVKARSGAEILQNPVAPRPSRGSVMQGWREGSAISARDLATTLPIWLGTSPGVPSPRQPQKMIGPRGSCGVASAPRLAG